MKILTHRQCHSIAYINEYFFIGLQKIGKSVKNCLDRLHRNVKIENFFLILWLCLKNIRPYIKSKYQGLSKNKGKQKTAKINVYKTKKYVKKDKNEHLTKQYNKKYNTIESRM